MKNELFYLTFLISLCSFGCSTMNGTIGDLKDDQITSNAKFENFKEVEIWFTWKRNSHGVFSEQARVNRTLGILKNIKYKLGSNSCFSKVYIEPSEVDSLTRSTSHNKILSLTIEINEDIVEQEKLSSKLKRIFSFGFYPQKVDKLISIDLSIDKKNYFNRSSRFHEEYKAPALLYAIDLETHPFTTEKQIEFYSEYVLSTMKKANIPCTN